jgi:hypothetical protein
MEAVIQVMAAWAVTLCSNVDSNMSEDTAVSIFDLDMEEVQSTSFNVIYLRSVLILSSHISASPRFSFQGFPTNILYEFLIPSKSVLCPNHHRIQVMKPHTM